MFLCMCVCVCVCACAHACMCVCVCVMHTYMCMSKMDVVLFLSFNGDLSVNAHMRLYSRKLLFSNKYL